MTWRLAWRDLLRRPARTGLTLAGLSLAIAVLASLSALGEGYRHALHTELDGMGMQLMLVPLGCPYDAAARVLHGKQLDYTLPAGAVDEARRDPAVAVAAPLLAAAIPQPRAGRTDMWVGLDRAAIALRPWWRAREGAAWFGGPNEVILGAEAAATELRRVGDELNSPETGRTFRVAGVLERSGTSDDSLFFLPLATAQAMFGQSGRLTAVALRLKDPALAPEASERLQRISGAQVVTLTEMMGTFLNLLGSVRTLLLAITAVALAAGTLGVFNTLLGAVVEQMPELALTRALGASRGQVFALVAVEALVLAGVATLLGLAGAALLAGAIEGWVRPLLPMAPAGRLVTLTFSTALQCAGVGLCIGGLAGLGPAWHASRAAPALVMRTA